MQLEVYDAVQDRDGEPHASEAPKVDQKAEIPKLDIIVVLWLILFVFGGGLLALYYAGINYFPEVSWQDALTSMALMAIIGGSLLVAYCFLLFVPGAIWSQFLICDKQLHEVLMMGARLWEPCVWSVIKRILFPFALFMAFCHFLLDLYDNSLPGFVPLGAAASLAAVSGLLGRDLGEGLKTVAREKARGQSQRDSSVKDASRFWLHRLHVAATHAPLLVAFIAKINHRDCPLSFLWIAALLPLVSFAVLLPKPALEPYLIPDKWSLLCRAILAFDSAALLSLTALWFFFRVYKGTPGTQNEVPWTLLLLCTVVVIVTNLAVSVLYANDRRVALLTSFLAALLLLGAGQLLETESHEQLPAKIMENFGFGGESATLVLTELGGRLLCQQGIPVEFEEEAKSTNSGQAGSPGTNNEKPGGPEKTDSSKKTAEDKPREEGPLARVGGMTILSRLGSEYLLRFEEEGWIITLPKKEVVSWSTSPNPQSMPDAQQDVALAAKIRRWQALEKTLGPQIDEMSQKRPELDLKAKFLKFQANLESATLRKQVKKPRVGPTKDKALSQPEQEVLKTEELFTSLRVSSNAILGTKDCPLTKHP